MKNVYIAGLASAAALTLAGCLSHIPQANPIAPVAARAAYDAKLARELLAFHQGRVKNDPGGAIGWAQLSSAYLKLAREGDSNELAEKAEMAARKSLQLRSKRNARAAMLLADSLLEQHRFLDALKASTKALELEPDAKTALRQHVEILVELGRYEEAKALMRRMPWMHEDPSSVALIARWEEVHGRPESALSLMTEATMMMAKDLSASPESVAWFYQKLGDVQARSGDPVAAERSYRTALNLYPQDYKAMAAMTRLAASESRWKDVIHWSSKTGEIAQMTDIYGLIGDAYKNLGDVETAKKQYARVDQLNQKTIDIFRYEQAHGHEPHGVVEKHTHDRLYAEYLADHGRNLPLAVHAAGDDLAIRQDVHAYRTYAWVMHKAGDDKAAGKAIAKALSTGDREPRMLYQAGVIHSAVGERDLAIRELADAAAIRSGLYPEERRTAEELLAKLKK